MKDYYKILQVASDASPEVIQMAYKALAKKYHLTLICAARRDRMKVFTK